MAGAQLFTQHVGYDQGSAPGMSGQNHHSQNGRASESKSNPSLLQSTGENKDSKNYEQSESNLELRRQIAEMEKRLSDLESKVALSKMPLSADASSEHGDEQSPPSKVRGTSCTIWGGPIMPSDDQNLW